MKCVRPSCDHVGRVGHRGLCDKHFKASQRERIASGEWIPGTVPASEVLAHIDFLRANGMSYRRISAASGVSTFGLQKMRTRQGVRKGNAERIFAVRPHQEPSGESGYIPAVGTSRRLQALIAIGYTQQSLADQLGSGNHKWVSDIIYARCPSVQLRSAWKVKELFRTLQLTPAAPCRAATRARNLAVKHDWPAPLFWDEDTIDDPNETPQELTSRRVPWHEKYDELRDLGVTDVRQIAKRMGTHVDVLKRNLQRRAA